MCDKDGNILTDEEFLAEIGDYIWMRKPPFPCMIKKALQVSLATSKPTCKEEFLKCKGAGEKLYEKCGEELMNFIKDYERKRLSALE